MAIKKISANLLANNAVHTANIASGAISAADIADNSITAAKISASTSPTFGGLTLGTDASGANISLKNSSYGSTGLARFYGTDGNEKLQVGTNANTQALIYTFSNVNLDFTIGTNTSTLHLKSTGKIGVGTNDPGTQLEVRTDTSSTTFGDYPAITIRNDNATGVGVIHFNEGSTQRARIELHNNSGSPYLLLNTTSAADNGIYINSSGNVGIGTNSPNLSSGASGSTVLTISATASARNALIELDGTRTSNGDPVSYFRTFNNTAATPLTDIRSIRGASDTSGSLEFYTSNALALAITESGIADFGTTGALRLPRGTTGQRPTGAQGHIRYNNTTHKLEYYQTDLGEWLRIQTDGGINFVNPTTYFTDRFAISADGQSADADNTSGYGAVSTNANFEGNFILITKWAHDYMGIGIAYKDNLLNSNFTGESNDAGGPYGGSTVNDGFDSTVSYMGQYHWPVLNGGSDDHQTTWYIKHQRSGNTISTHYSTNSNAADDPVHSSWTQVQSATISSTNHCKPVWGEASGSENQILTFTYKEVTGDYNFS